MLEQIGPWCNAQAGNDKPQKQQARQGNKFGNPEKTGNQRRGKEQNEVERNAAQRTEPEDSIVVAVLGLLLVGQCRDESSFLQGRGNGRKDRKQSHHTVVGTVEQACQKDSEDKVQQLLYAVAESSPEQAAGGFLFQ